jgi:hypothetical protein
MDLQQGLWWLSIGTESAALASLLLRRIAASYRWFATYLAFGVARDIALHFAGDPNRSRNYATAWMITEPILLTLLVLTTREIVGKVPGHYRGFGSFGRQKLRRLLDIAVAVALVSSVVEAAGPQWKWSIAILLRFVFGLHRITTSILAVYLVLVAIFVSRVRVPFRRNLLIHSRLFAGYLTLQTGLMVFLGAIGHSTVRMGDVLTGGSSLLFVLWTVLLTREGETPPPRKVLTPLEIRANEDRERELQEAAMRYSDRPRG